MDYGDGRLLYLLLFLALLVYFARGERIRPARGIRDLAIWGIVLLAIAVGYAILAG